MHILNGRLFDDKAGNYTCLTYNGASVEDYRIASTSLFQFVKHFAVLRKDEFDHLPIYASLEFSLLEKHPHDNNVLINQDYFEGFLVFK